MKQRIILTLTLMQGTGLTAFADDGERQLSSGELMNYIGYGAIVFTLLLFVVVMLVLLRTFKIITKVMMGAKAYREMLEEEAAAKRSKKEAVKKEKGSLALRFMSLKPMSEEHTLVMEHSYDGIRELNNPTPKWFMYLFYISMLFAVGYLLNYHVFHTGQLQYDEYKTEVAIADKAKEAYLAKAANRVDENTVKPSTDAAVLISGKAIFTERCSPCHGDHAQGVVGPNLTDDYWLHGNKISDVFKTIKYGVPAKGMPTWEKQLSPKQIADVANFIKSLHGSNPVNPKEPQGEKMAEENDKAEAPRTAMLNHK